MIMNPLFYLVAEIKVKRLSFNFLLVLIPYLINSFFIIVRNCSRSGEESSSEE